jgi:hypothetical protein
VRRFYTARDILVPARLWIEVTDGTRVRAPVQRVRQVFMGSMISDGGSWLTTGRYEALLRTLDHWLAAARSSDSRQTVNEFFTRGRQPPATGGA